MAEKATKRTYKPRALSVPYEEDKAEAILQRLASGETLTSICQSMGIKPYHVYLWTEKDFSGFRQRFARARDFGSEVLEDEAVDIADGRKADCDETETESDSGFSTTKRRYDNVARSRLMAETRMKIVARRRGSKVDVKAKVETTEKAQELTTVQQQVLDKVLDDNF